MDFFQLELPLLWAFHDGSWHIPYDSWRKILQGYNVHGRLSISDRIHLNRYVCLSLPAQFSHVGCLAYSLCKSRHGIRYWLCYSIMVTSWCSSNWFMAWRSLWSHSLLLSFPHICKRKSNFSSLASYCILCYCSFSALYDIL